MICYWKLVSLSTSRYSIATIQKTHILSLTRKENFYTMQLPDNATRPYEDHQLPTIEEWKLIPESRVHISLLVPTQYYVVIDHLKRIANGGLPEGLDIPHIVRCGGVLYIHDGHHRIVIGAIYTVSYVSVRIFNID